jgi:hypothetical protein
MQVTSISSIGDARTRRSGVTASLIGAAIACFLLQAPPSEAQPSGRGWALEGGVGFLANTPDDAAFALNISFDGFPSKRFSLGPLLQLGFTDDLAQVGLSGQGKMWFDLGSDLKASVQAGVGFVHADFQSDDTSFLIPVGAGLHYWVTRDVALGGTFLLNFTDLDTGPGGDTNVMPGLTFGVRY